MTWRTIWHDTDKLIEQDDATLDADGNPVQRTTWLNPAAEGARLDATERTTGAIVDILTESLGVEL